MAKKPNVKPIFVDSDYTTRIIMAMETHQPCESSGVATALIPVLEMLRRNSIRQPDDWSPNWPGAFEMVWSCRDADACGKSNSRYVSLEVVPIGGKQVRLNVHVKFASKRLSEDSSSIPCDDIEQAEALLPVLIKIVDGQSVCSETVNPF